MTTTTHPENFDESRCWTPFWVGLNLAIRLRELCQLYSDDPFHTPTVLDAGCGRGALADPLAERGWFEVFGVDSTPYSGGRYRGRAVGNFLSPIAEWVWSGFAPPQSFDATIFNSPFTIKEAYKKGRYRASYDGPRLFIDRAKAISPIIASLHRSAWFQEMQLDGDGGLSRSEWRGDLRRNYVTEQMALGRVPFMDGEKAVDSTTYCWTIARRPLPQDGPGPWPTLLYDASVRPEAPRAGGGDVDGTHS
jgi:SAM-dependent methyltransferase